MKMWKLGMATLAIAMFATTGASAALHSENFDSYADGTVLEDAGTGWVRGQVASGKHGIPEAITVTGGKATGTWGGGVGISAGKDIDASWVTSDGKIEITGDFTVSAGWIRFEVGPRSSVLETTDKNNETRFQLNFDNRSHFTEAKMWNEASLNGSAAGGAGTLVIPTNLVIPGTGVVSDTGAGQLRWIVDVSGDAATNGQYTVEMRPINNTPAEWTTLGSYSGNDYADVTFDAFSINGQAGGWSWDNITFTPEPASLAMLGLGGLLMLRRRRA